jgi:hypothetical protein
MAFRTPTLLSSTERQLGQRAENTSGTRFRSTAGRCRESVAETLSGDGKLGFGAAGAIVTAGIARRFDLLLCSQVGLRESDFASFTRHLPLVTFR